MPNRSVLDMTSSEARKFFLKAESYFSVKLPPYFNLKEILDESAKLIGNSDINSISYGQKNIKKSNKNASELDVEYIKDASDVNLRIMANKDAKYAWRPFQLIHPILYVDLVNTITKDENWQTIVDRFSEFQSDNRINCISIPVESTGEKPDQAEQILNWWKNLEQAQIALSLDYEYCIHTDITDCYPSIYTHTIPWALHDKNWAKENRKEGIGNIIDSKLQSMQNGQTNGIPQGSSLMDFIAEMVLGYADTQLIKLANKKGLDNDYKILRYRDDYRIFSNQLNTAESLMKILSEVLLDLNLKINSKKTFLCNDIIIDGVKPDKIYWTTQSANFFNYTTQISIDIKGDKDLKVSGNLNNNERKRHYKINLQKHLLQIKILGDKFPNCGQLNKALTDFYKYRISKLDAKENQLEDIPQLISILTSIMLKNPRSIELCVIILAKLFNFLNKSQINQTIDSILRKFSYLPNTDFIEIWLQRISILSFPEKQYESILCQKVSNTENINLWNSRWLKPNKRPNENLIIDKEKLSELTLDTDIADVDSFINTFES